MFIHIFFCCEFRFRQHFTFQKQCEEAKKKTHGQNLNLFIYLKLNETKHDLDSAEMFL